MKNNRIMRLLALVMLLAFMTGCNERRGEIGEIAVIVKSTTSDFWQKRRRSRRYRV